MRTAGRDALGSISAPITITPASAGKNAEPANGCAPPSGNAIVSSAIGVSAAIVSAAGQARIGQTRAGLVPAGSLSAQAIQASARNAPATGLASAVTTLSASALAKCPRRAASSAPRPIARPRSNGTRLDSSATDAPSANHSAAMRVARGGKQPSISRANSAVAATIETAASGCGPISAPSAGASSE